MRCIDHKQASSGAAALALQLYAPRGDGRFSLRDDASRGLSHAHGIHTDGRTRLTHDSQKLKRVTVVRVSTRATN